MAVAVAGGVVAVRALLYPAAYLRCPLDGESLPFTRQPIRWPVPWFAFARLRLLRCCECVGQ